MNSSAVFVEPNQGKVLQVLSDKIRVLASGQQTAGKYEVFELSGHEGSGPPPHSHPWDEAYFVLYGEIEVRVGGRQTRAKTGAFVLAPAETVHSFRIVTPSARFIVMTSGSRGSAFFEAMDREIGFPPASFEAVCAVAERQGPRLPADSAAFSSA